MEIVKSVDDVSTLGHSSAMVNVLNHTIKTGHLPYGYSECNVNNYNEWTDKLINVHEYIIACYIPLLHCCYVFYMP